MPVDFLTPEQRARYGRARPRNPSVQRAAVESLRQQPYRDEIARLRAEYQELIDGLHAGLGTSSLPPVTRRTSVDMSST